LFYLIDLGCDQISNVRTSIWLTILDQQQLANLMKREAKALCATNQLQSLDCSFVIDPVACRGSLCRRNQAHLFIESDGVDTQPCVLCDASNLHGQLSLTASIKSGVHSSVKQPGRLKDIRATAHRDSLYRRCASGTAARHLLFA